LKLRFGLVEKELLAPLTPPVAVVGAAVATGGLEATLGLEVAEVPGTVALDQGFEVARGRTGVALII